MKPRERVMTALRGEEPDRVPYCELGIDRALAQRLLGWGQPADQTFDLEANQYTITEAKAIAAALQLDNIYYVLRAPVYAYKHPGEDGRLFYGDGQIKTEADLDKLVLPDPTDDHLYAGAATFGREKADYAAWLVTRIGIFPAMMSMGIESFSLALYENRALVEAVLDRYADWATAVVERVGRLGFDILITTDDLAFKTGPFLSPAVFRELVLPYYRRIAETTTIPWVVHSDGNITPYLDDLVDLGIAGLHPLEKGAMDIRAIKQRYGKRICLLGNVDLNLLGMGSPEAVTAEVRWLIREIGPGGGYIVTCGNSLAGYLLPENVRALGRAVRMYGRYPLA